MSQKGIIVVVSGFSGAGKGTLMKLLVNQYDNYALSVSMTTRAPREGEIDGKDYFFVDDEKFEELIRKDAFLEHAGYCKHYYGTPAEFVEQKLNAGVDVILEIEIQGALQIKAKYPEALLLFVMPPTVSELHSRLVKRATESPEVINERLYRAKEEAKGIEHYDFILINDDLEECANRMHEVISAAHYTPDRNKEFIETIRSELKEYAAGE